MNIWSPQRNRFVIGSVFIAGLVAISLVVIWISRQSLTWQLNFYIAGLLSAQITISCAVIIHGILAWKSTYKRRSLTEKAPMYRELLTICSTVATALSLVLVAASYAFSNIKTWQARHPDIWVYKTETGNFGVTNYGGGNAAFVFIYTRSQSSRWQLDTYSPGILPGQTLRISANWPVRTLVTFHADGDEQWCAWQTLGANGAYSISQKPVKDSGSCFSIDPFK